MYFVDDKYPIKMSMSLVKYITLQPISTQVGTKNPEALFNVCFVRAACHSLIKLTPGDGNSLCC